MSKNLQIMNADLSWKITTIFCLSAMAMMVPELTMASSDAIGKTMCKIIARLQGKIGRGIATIAVVFLGIGLFLGKLSWGLAVAIGIGIGGIFGSSTIVSWLGKDENSVGSDGKCTAADLSDN
jgi:type IV secretory pathway VirB2 component (pilin)